MTEANTQLKTDSKELIRVSISEAARLFGVNSQTIRRAIKAQELTYVVVSGRYKLNFESLVKWSQHHTTLRNKLAKRGIGQFIDKWKISNPLFSPNPKSIIKKIPSAEPTNHPEENEKPNEPASAPPPTPLPNKNP